MKKGFLFLLTFIVFFFFSSIGAAEFWGSKNSKKYHYPTCKWAQKINPANLVKFETPEKAITAGYVPCKVCKPPAMSKATSGTSQSIEFTIARVSYDGKNPQKRGCCSWHGGVCGCQNGRVACCDGTYSPSCTCAH